MKTIAVGVLAIMTIFFSGDSVVWAKADWQVIHSLNLKTTPVDVVVSSDNRWIYLLDNQGQLLIYGFNGQLRDTINVGSDIDEIKAGPREDLLFLLSRSKSSLQLISINVIENINIERAPYEGPEQAPITVAVFSDFQ